MEASQIYLMTDVQFKPDKAAILAMLECDEQSPVYREISAIYDQYSETAGLAVKPQAAFVYGEKPAHLQDVRIDGCSRLIYCLVTIGDKLAAESTACFQAGLYAKGLLLDAIANYALFECSRQLYQYIVCEIQPAGLGLTRRLSPGEADFAADWQATILKQFAAIGAFGVTLTEGCMLNPVKSLAYVYGADVSLPMTFTDHDCSDCGRLDCKLRKGSGHGKTVTLTVVDADRRQRISANPTQSIMTALSAHGLRIHSPCGGRGTCGKCKIHLSSGQVTQQGHIAGDLFLACLTHPLTDCEIDIRSAQETAYQAVTAFQTGVVKPDSGFHIMEIAFTAADWQVGDSLTRLINRQLGHEHTYSLKVLRKLAFIKHRDKAEASVEKLVIRGTQIVDILPRDAERLLGLAIDIGTTTLALSLVDLCSGAVIKSYSYLNNQRRYGADVISRIQYSIEQDAAALHASICTDIVKGVRELDAQTRETIVHVAITGNTAMLHFLLGLPAGTLGHYPFQPITTEGQEFPFEELFGDSALDCPVTILPGISAFVGADVTAGLLQCGFADTDKIRVLMDIGTNGEIAIGNKHRILCLSTAAGPAFEGANITCGTGSVDGAIASFRIADGLPVYTTIHDAKPAGICGSGVIDIMAACVQNRVVNSTGRFDQQRYPDNRLPVTQTEQGEGIYFTQKDVRELQLAKSAVRAGLEVLLTAYGCSYNAVDAVYLAGSFGRYISVDSAVAIGLLPGELRSKVRTVDNSALGGTVKYLLAQSSQQTIRELLAVSSYLDLAADSHFNEQFIAYMEFPCV